MTRNRNLLIAVAGLLTMGCGSDSTGPEGAGTPNSVANMVKATINDTAFRATTVIGRFRNGSLSITGVNGSRSVMITAGNLAGAGNYLLYAGNPYTGLATIIDGNSGQFSTGYGGQGTLILTIASPEHIRGNFRFTAYTSAGSGAGKPVATAVDGVFDITVP